MSDYIEEQAELLMQAYDSHLVPFFSEGAPFFADGFAPQAAEMLCDMDSNEEFILQIVLACLNDKPVLAKKLAEQYREPLKAVAVTMIKAAIERSNAEDAA